MLTKLFISNYALIDQLELDLQPGMNVITGETGAGKSIMVDALMFATGSRPGTEIIRHGCEKAEVTATFSLPSKDRKSTRLNSSH